MMTYKSEKNEFAELLGDHKYEVNPFFESLKSLFGLSKHTVPALFLAFSERLPKIKPEYYIEMGEKLKKELEIILGKLI